MPSGLKTFIAAALVTLALAWATAGRAGDTPAPAVTEQDVRVERNDGGFSIDVVMHAPATPTQAWVVLTDFDHMAEFIPGLTHSRVLERGESTLRIAQQGKTRWGLITMNFESVREVKLVPLREIRSHGVSGTAKRIDSLMQLDVEPGGTRLHYHAEVDPGSWFPPGLGPAKVQQDTAAQFSAILQEVMRRRGS